MTLSASLHPAASMGPVALRARDRDALAGWYRRVFGLVALAGDDRAVVLGPDGGPPLVTLVSDPAAPLAPRAAAGLYHLAILLPGRADLGRWLRRLAGLGLRLDGAADHLVSEATYLSDPEGNGIEVYRDRPREEWPRRPDGGLRMDNAPLDLRGILAAGDAAGPAAGIPPGSVMGHVHLKVSDLAASRRFYVDGLGFGPTEEGYPSALFVATGGYHHHLGLNTWESAGRSRPAGATGFEAASLLVPPEALVALSARLAARAIPFTELEDGLKVVDPSGNPLVVVAADHMDGARALAL